jgi:hypothetical protein
MTVRILAKLRSCRFCGAKPVFEEDRSDLPYHNMYFLGCSKCSWGIETTYYRKLRRIIGSGANQIIFAIVDNRLPHQMVSEWNYYN